MIASVLDPGGLPEGIASVADLVRRTVPLNARLLARAGARPPDPWSVLAALAAEHGKLPPGAIGPGTFLLRPPPARREAQQTTRPLSS